MHDDSELHFYHKRKIIDEKGYTHGACHSGSGLSMHPCGFCTHCQVTWKCYMSKPEGSYFCGFVWVCLYVCDVPSQGVFARLRKVSIHIGAGWDPSCCAVRPVVVRRPWHIWVIFGNISLFACSSFWESSNILPLFDIIWGPNLCMCGNKPRSQCYQWSNMLQMDCGCSTSALHSIPALRLYIFSCLLVPRRVAFPWRLAMHP